MNIMMLLLIFLITIYILACRASILPLFLFGFNVFSFCEVFSFVYQGLIFFRWLHIFFKLVQLLSFFMDTFIWSPQRMNFWFLSWRLIKDITLEHPIFVHCFGCSLSLKILIMLFFITLTFFLNQIFRRAKRANQTHICLLLCLFYVLIYQVSVILSRKLFVIVHRDSYLWICSYNFLLVIKFP
jgi:hypothetical protein